jgi:hypothetical protein
MISVPWKLIMVDEDWWDKRRLFRRGDYRTKRNNNEISVLVSSSGEDGFSENWELIPVDDYLKANELKIMKQQF